MRSIASLLQSWPAFLVLIHGFFFSRALILLIALPPFEGWDEYQHIAYIQFIIDEHRLPQRGDQVPLSLYQDLVNYPHPFFAEEQLRPMGGMSYAHYWRFFETPRRFLHVPVDLYESQHPPLYYLLARFVYEPIKRARGLLDAISVLRIVNILLGGATITLFAVGLRSRLPDGILRRFPLVILATQPLFLASVVRVANDPLALFLSTAAAIVALKGMPRYPALSSVIAGLLAGLGMMSKGIAFPVLVSLAIFVTWQQWQSRAGVRGIFASLAWLALGAIVPAGIEIAKNLAAYGTPFPLMDILLNSDKGTSVGDLWKAGTAISWLREFDIRYSNHYLYVGGWSMFYPSTGIEMIHRILLLSAIAGCFFAILRRLLRKTSSFPETAGLNVLAGSITITSAGLLAIHMILIQATYGVASYTNVWYALASIPWMSLLLVEGWFGLAKWWSTFVIGTLMLSLHLFVEYSILLNEAVPYYTQSMDSALSLERLSLMHPSWLPATVLFPASITTACLAAVVVILASIRRNISTTNVF